MPEYRRLISYMYEYEGENKGKNVGFVKLESRNGQCRLDVNVKRIFLGGNAIGVYLLGKDGGKTFLGNMFVRGGNGEFRTMVDAANVENSGSGMDMYYGMAVHDVKNSWRSYKTIWEDAVVPGAETREETIVVTASQEAAPSETGEDVAVHMEDVAVWPSAAAGREESVRESESKSVSKHVLESVSEHWALSSQNALDEVRLETPAVSALEPMKAAEVSSAESAVQLDIAEGPIAEDVLPASEPADVLCRAESVAKELEEELREAEAQALEAPAPVSSGIGESETVIPEQPELSAQQERTGRPGAVTNPESSDRSEPSVQPVSPELENPEVLRYLQETESRQVDSETLWQELRKSYPKIMPFDYESGCEVLTIRPEDIGRLPRENWIYGNNSFLLHGYYNFRYLILTRLEHAENGPRYLIGVPGHYYSNEKYMASMFGFPNFVLSKHQPPNDGRFGYWYTNIKM